MARMAELHPVARSPFARILSTAAFRSSCVGVSVSSHLKLCFLQPFVKNLAPIEDSVVEFKLKDGARISLRSSPRWNATRWNFSGLLRDVFDDAKFVIWHSEKENRFIPALYCSNRKTAAFIVQFMGRIRVCPKCGVPFIPLAGNVDYCCPAHREAHRVARSRWRAKQKPEGKKKK
jgi:hypothetical protein